MSRRPYRRYDPRLKNLVAESEDISQFHCYGIPNSTLRQWKKNGHQKFFTIPVLNLSNNELIQENIALKSQLSAVIAEHDLVATTIKIFGFQIQYKRLPSSDAKAEIQAAIKKASECISLQACLFAIQLTAAKYHHWVKRQVACKTARIGSNTSRRCQPCLE